MSAGEFNFIGKYAIERGATWRVRIQLVDDDEIPLSLIGYTAKMQVRKTISSSTVLAELSTANGRISLTDGALGYIDLEITSADTTPMEWNRGVYDLEITYQTIVSRVLYGTIETSKEVTR